MSSTTGTLIGAVVGGAIGFIIGGPLGAGIGMSLGSAIGGGVGMYLNPIKPDIKQPGVPTVDPFQPPTASEWPIIMDVLGTVKVTGNIFAYGDNRSEEITETTEVADGKDTDTVTTVTGHVYYLTWMVGLCKGPVDRIMTVYKEDRVVWKGFVSCPTDGSGVDIELQGMGTMTFYFGTQTQDVDAWGPPNVVPSLRSPYLGLCYAVFRDCKIGRYNRAPGMRFVIQKSPRYDYDALPDAYWTDERIDCIDVLDYNPVHAIYYIMTKMMKILPYFIDGYETFQTAAQRIHDVDKLGISITFDTQQYAQVYVDAILQHIDAVMFQGIDGYFKIMLKRNVGLTGVPVLTERNILEPPEISRRSLEDTINEIKVQYYRRSGFTGVTAEIEDLIVLAAENYATGNRVVWEGIRRSNSAIVWHQRMNHENHNSANPTVARIAAYARGTAFDKVIYNEDPLDEGSLHSIYGWSFAKTAIYNEATERVKVWNPFHYVAWPHNWHADLKCFQLSTDNIDSFTDPVSVAVDDDYIYIADRGATQRIVKLDKSDFSFVTEWEIDCYGLAVDDDYLYIADSSNHQIVKIDKNTFAVILQIGEWGTGDDQFRDPSGIAVDSTHIFVSDYGNHRIVKRLKSDLSYVSKIGSSGSGDDQFTSPVGISVGDTHVYIADSGNDRIVKRLKSDLSYVAKIGSYGDGNNNFDNPQGIAVDDYDSYVYVADTFNNRIVKRLKSTLAYVDEVGSYGTTGNNHFNYPLGVGVANGSHFYFADEQNNKIQKRERSDLSYVDSVVEFRQWTANAKGFVIASMGQEIAGSHTKYHVKVSKDCGRIFSDIGVVHESYGLETHNYLHGVAVDDHGNILAWVPHISGGVVTQIWIYFARYPSFSFWYSMGNVNGDFKDAANTVMSVSIDSTGANWTIYLVTIDSNNDIVLYSATNEIGFYLSSLAQVWTSHPTFDVGASGVVGMAAYRDTVVLYYLDASDGHYKLVRSTDGGVNFSLVWDVGTDSEMADFVLNNEQNSFVFTYNGMKAGDYLAFYMSRDGGETWETISCNLATAEVGGVGYRMQSVDIQTVSLLEEGGEAEVEP